MRAFVDTLGVGGTGRVRGSRAARGVAGSAAAAAGLLERHVFVVFVLAVATALQAALERTAVVSDAWYMLLGGRIVASGLPHHDTLTVLASGRAWVDQQWLAQLSLYGLWREGGWPLVLAAPVVCFVGAFAVAAVGARRLGASERSVAIVLVPCLLVALPNTALRAQVLAYPLFALVLALVLDDERRAGRRVWLVLPLLVLWANLHGSVVLGAAVAAAHGGVSALRRRPLPRSLALVALPWLCMLASPYALELPGYYRRVLVNPAFGRLVAEWGPTTLRGEPLFFVLLLAGIALVAAQLRRLGAVAPVVFAATGIAGLLALRNVVWFAFAAAVVLPPALDGIWRPKHAPRHVRVNLAIVLCAVAGGATVAAAAASHPASWYERAYPSAAGNAAAAAARSPQVRVFANERFADWLLFRHPQLAGRVAYDVRFELLDAAQLEALAGFRQRVGNWRDAVRRYEVLVLDPDADPVAALERERRTRILYRSRDVVVLRR